MELWKIDRLSRILTEGQLLLIEDALKLLPPEKDGPFLDELKEAVTEARRMAHWFNRHD